MIKGLGKQLFAICHAYGINNPPSEMDMVTIIRFIKDNYRDFSFEEITAAFEYNAAGKLPGGTIDSFQSFNIVFIGKVLNAYKSYRTEELKKHKQSAPSLPENTEDNRTAEQKEADMYLSLVKYIREHGQMPISWDWKTIYAYLERVGDIALSKDEKELFAENVRETINEEARQKKENGERLVAKEIINSLSDKQAFQTRCRIEYAKTFIRSKFNL